MYVDSHTHLDFFNENIDKAIKDINRNKIITVANSMNLESYILNKEYSRKSKYIIPTFGIHPWKVAEFNDELDTLIPYIKESPLIGEIGLDYVWVEDKSTFDKQRKVFKFILEQSKAMGKVASIHTKGAEEEIYNELKRLDYNNVIIHWYSGELDTLKKLIAIGCYFTISVDIGYSKITDEIVKLIPINKLLVETDGPTALEWVNGEYAYPNKIKDVVRLVGEKINIEEENMREILHNNWNELLRISKNYSLIKKY